MTSLVIQTDRNGNLLSFIPKKIFYALFTQGIIQKQNGNWQIDLTKQDQIRVPLEIVDGATQTATTKPKTRAKRKSDYEKLKTLFLEALEKANQEITEYIQTKMNEEIPVFAVGEPANMMASLQGKPSPLKNVIGIMRGTCGFVWFGWVKLNTKIGRFVSKWDKEGNAPFRLSKSSHYGNSLHLDFKSITGRNVQIMELKSHAYHVFKRLFNELLKSNGFEEIDWYIRTRID